MVQISVIIPVYNAERYLSACLNSIIEQDFKELEIILIDDGSTDSSGKICDEYAKKDSRLRVIHKKNEGVSIARNTGLDNATGKWITFVDADDWIEKDTYKELSLILEKNEPDILIYNYYDNNKENALYIKTGTFEDKDEIENLKNKIIYPLIENEESAVYSFVWNKIFKKSIIDKNNIRFKMENKKAIFEDGIFCIEALENSNKVEICNKYLYYYRSNSSSAMNSYNKDILEINDIIFKTIKDRCSEDAFKFRVIRQFILLCKLKIFNKENTSKNIKKEVAAVLANSPYKENVIIDKKIKLSMKQKIFIFFSKRKCIKLTKLLCQM